MKITHKHGLIIRESIYSELAQELLNLDMKDDISYVVLQVEHIADKVIFEIVEKKLYFREEKPTGTKYIEDIINSELNKKRTMPRFPGDIPTYNGVTQINISPGEELIDNMRKDIIKNLHNPLQGKY